MSLDFSIEPNPSSRTMALGSTQPLTEMSTRNLPGGKGRPARKADNLTAICEPIVLKMWEPRRLTTLWVSKACYRYSFICLRDRRKVPPKGWCQSTRRNDVTSQWQAGPVQVAVCRCWASCSTWLEQVSLLRPHGGEYEDTVFWDVTPCSLEDMYQTTQHPRRLFSSPCIFLTEWHCFTKHFLLPWRWKQYFSFKRWCLPAYILPERHTHCAFVWCSVHVPQ
jgi:hypothetical protein